MPYSAQRDLRGKHPLDTYAYMMSVDPTGSLFDGTGSQVVNINVTSSNAVSSSYSLSASYEIIYETSSSYAESASLSNYATTSSYAKTASLSYIARDVIEPGVDGFGEGLPIDVLGANAGIGSKITVQAGHGDVGGNLYLQAGTSSIESGEGGDVNILAGYASNGQGGTVTIQGGQGTASVESSVTIYGNPEGNSIGAAGTVTSLGRYINLTTLTGSISIGEGNVSVSGSRISLSGSILYGTSSWSLNVSASNIFGGLTQNIYFVSESFTTMSFVNGLLISVI